MSTFSAIDCPDFKIWSVPMSNKSHITIKVIAESAKVAISTVSRVISGQAEKYRISKKTEEIVLKLTRSIAKDTGAKNLCLAGGVALNCVANGKILKDNSFDNIWIQPAAGDAGGALGAALCAYHRFQHQPRKLNASEDVCSSGCYHDMLQGLIHAATARCISGDVHVPSAHVRRGPRRRQRLPRPA